MKKCPFCAEEIKDEAIRCKHCQADVAFGVCIACGKRNSLGDKLCVHCGSNKLIGDLGGIEKPHSAELVGIEVHKEVGQDISQGERSTVVSNAVSFDRTSHDDKGFVSNAPTINVPDPKEEAKPIRIDNTNAGQPQPEDATLKWSKLNDEAGVHYQSKDYEGGVVVALNALSSAEQGFGVNHENTATSLNNLALLYKAQGKYGEAESRFKQALEIYEKVLGRKHAKTLAVVKNLYDLACAKCEDAPLDPTLVTKGIEKITEFKQQLGANFKPIDPVKPDSISNQKLLVAFAFATILGGISNTISSGVFTVIGCLTAGVIILVVSGILFSMFRWVMHLVKVQLTQNSSLAVLLIIIGLFGSMIIVGNLYNRAQQSHLKLMSDSSSGGGAGDNEGNFVFQPKGCDYSVTFAKKPDISDSTASLFDRQVKGILAMVSIPGGNGFFRAECYQVSPDLISQVTKEFSFVSMQMIADAAGLKYPHSSYSETKDGKMGETRATKTLVDQSGNKVDILQNMRIYYGGKSVFMLMTTAVADKFPTPAQIDFRDSVKRY